MMSIHIFIYIIYCSLFGFLYSTITTLARGIWSSCMQVGGVIANNFAALTVEVTGGWRAAFTYPAIVLGAAGILVALFMPNSKKSKFVADTDKVKTEVMQKMQKKKTTSSFLGTIMAPGVMQLAVSYFCIKYVFYL